MAAKREEQLFVCKEDDEDKEDAGEKEEEEVHETPAVWRGEGGEEGGGEDVKAEKARKVRTRKSFVSALFGRTGVGL